MAAYSKLIAAIVGVALTWLNQKFGIDLTGESAAIVDIVLKVGTPLAVYLVPNTVS